MFLVLRRRGRHRRPHAFVDVVVRVSHLLHQFPQIKELDINPVRVFSQGAMALDCRMRVETS